VNISGRLIAAVMSLATTTAVLMTATPAHGAVPSGATPETTCTFTSTIAYKQGEKPPNSASLCAQQRAAVLTANANTPDGYKLPAGTKSGRSFTTPLYYAYELSSSGAVTSRVLEGFSEVILNDATHRWTIHVFNHRDFGLSFSSTYDYYCGVNVSGSDPTCDTWSGNAGAQGHLSGSFPSGDLTFTRAYGSKQGKKFPMIRDQITWSDGRTNIADDGKPGWKVRGYDMCQSLTVDELCPTSGTGN
jgi:hypothetical protein